MTPEVAWAGPSVLSATEARHKGLGAYYRSLRENPHSSPEKRRENYLKYVAPADGQLGAAMHNQVQERLAAQGVKLNSADWEEAIPSEVDDSDLEEDDAPVAKPKSPAKPVSRSRDSGKPRVVLDGKGIPEEVQFSGKNKSEAKERQPSGQ